MKYSTRTLALLLVSTLLLASLLTGCATATTGATGTPAPTKTAEKTKVDFWYLWSSTSETTFIEQGLIAEFNKSQDKVEVVGLSAPDIQKMIVAISAGNGPDITDNFSNNIASYADQGILEPLDSYITASKYDTSDYIPAALNTCIYKGKTYALPMTASTFLMFYNKKLFAEAGITEPPKTDKELLADAILLTKLNDDKTIDVLGYPDYPFVYYTNNMSYSLGGGLMDDAGKFTLDNTGTNLALQSLVDYRTKYGVENVLKFSSSAKYCDPADPFVMGKQAIRIDGPWFGNTIKNVIKADIDYGVAPLPYPDGHPELAKTGLLDSSVFFISATSKNKEGAWAFMSWLYEGPQMLAFCSTMANIPAKKSLLSDPKITGNVDMPAFIDQLTSQNMKALPLNSKLTEVLTLRDAEIDLVVNLKKSIADGLSAANTQANALK